MTILLADMGGTSTRLALRREDGDLQGVVRWHNDNHAGPDALLLRYLQDCGEPPLRGACIAVAGPVGPGQVRLTNRDWGLDRARLAERLRLSGPGAVWLVNDLTALALALPELGAEQAEVLRAPRQGAAGNGQALVVNCGTGFNIGCVKQTPADPAVFEAELGHAALPVSVAAALGAPAEGFASIEALFSGTGLSRLHAARTDGAQRPAQELVHAAAEGDGPARESVARMAGLLGLLMRELVAAYLPRDGLFLAGSMARGVLQTPARAAFLRALDAPGPLSDMIAAMPLRLITDDGAALYGLARLARTLP